MRGPAARAPASPVYLPVALGDTLCTLRPRPAAGVAIVRAVRSLESGWRFPCAMVRGSALCRLLAVLALLCARGLRGRRG